MIIASAIFLCVFWLALFVSNTPYLTYPDPVVSEHVRLFDDAEVATILAALVAGI
jgi:hypothetical protein